MNHIVTIITLYNQKMFINLQANEKSFDIIFIKDDKDKQFKLTNLKNFQNSTSSLHHSFKCFHMTTSFDTSIT